MVPDLDLAGAVSDLPKAQVNEATGVHGDPVRRRTNPIGYANAGAVVAGGKDAFSGALEIAKGRPPAMALSDRIDGEIVAAGRRRDRRSKVQHAQGPRVHGLSHGERVGTGGDSQHDNCEVHDLLLCHRQPGFRLRRF